MCDLERFPKIRSHIWKLLPASDITFHNVRNHKAVERCLLILVYSLCIALFLENSLKNPIGSFSSFFCEETRSCPLWDGVKPGQGQGWGRGHKG